MIRRDKANWNLRVKTAALETILEVVEFWFMSVLADLCFCMRNKQLIYTRGSYEIFGSFLKLMFMCSHHQLKWNFCARSSAILPNYR